MPAKVTVSAASRINKSMLQLQHEVAFPENSWIPETDYSYSS